MLIQIGILSWLPSCKTLFSLKRPTSSFYQPIVRNRIIATRLHSSQRDIFHITGTLQPGNIEIGSYCELSHVFSQEDVNHFSNICGDNNPLHIDPIFATTTMFKRTIVHGILVSSLFSSLFGRSLAGSIYVSQNLSFKKPVFVGTGIKARIEVIKIEERKKGNLITCTTTCYIEDSKELAVDGEAKVLIPK